MTLYFLPDQVMGLLRLLNPWTDVRCPLEFHNLASSSHLLDVRVDYQYCDLEMTHSRPNEVKRNCEL